MRINKIMFSTLLCLLVLHETAKAESNSCKKLPSFKELHQALIAARKDNNGGLNLDMWGSIVDRSGIVCAVAFTGENEGAQWPGSRVIAAQKANTANAFSLPHLSLATAHLYTGTQPGGFLFGIQESNPVNTSVAYKGPSKSFGTSSDPMIGQRIGGVNVFGGGLGLYNKAGELLGGLGVSGDTSCADHNIAWRVRHALKLDYVPAGVAPDKSDQIIYDFSDSKSTSGYGHPQCGGREQDIAKELPATSTLQKQ